MSSPVSRMHQDPFVRLRRDARMICFSWDANKVRAASLLLLAAAIPAAAGVFVTDPFVKWLCVAWMLGIAYLMHLLGKRANADAVVLTIDERGILDRRLMSKRIEWQEIEAICPVDVERSHVVDLKLRWPATTLAQTRWSVRIGAACQAGCDVPAITLSMLLLEGNVSDLLHAIALHRSDLLHHTNQAFHRPARRSTDALERR
jgi:hypothetical protein